MTSSEQELIRMIRTAEYPDVALVTAVKVICDYLTQHESSAEQAAADLQVHA